MSGSISNRLRAGVARLPRPVGILLFLLTEVLLAEGGSLSAAVALAATAAAGSALVACSVISARCAAPVPRTRSVPPCATARNAPRSCRSATLTPRGVDGPEPPAMPS